MTPPSPLHAALTRLIVATVMVKAAFPMRNRVLERVTDGK